jgi:uncharacterized membrane protein YhaH (DUF805 family)
MNSDKYLAYALVLGVTGFFLAVDGSVLHMPLMNVISIPFCILSLAYSIASWIVFYERLHGLDK